MKNLYILYTTKTARREAQGKHRVYRHESLGFSRRKSEFPVMKPRGPENHENRAVTAALIVGK